MKLQALVAMHDVRSEAMHRMHFAIEAMHIAQPQSIYYICGAAQGAESHCIGSGLQCIHAAPRLRIRLSYLDVFEVVLQGGARPGVWAQQVPQRVLPAAT